MGRYDDDYETTNDDYEAPKKRRYEDDEEDEAPRRRPVAKDAEEDEDDAPKAARTIKRGWGAAEQVKNADSAFAQRLKVAEEPIIIKFLEDEPYASYRQHWVERQGQKSFTCIADIDDRGCPLCEVGNRPATRFAFNVALITDGDPSVKSYDVGPRVIDQLKNFHTDPRQGPLTKNYWAVSRTGKGTTSATNHQMVKERDLEDEWRVEPLDEAGMRLMKKQAYSPEIIPVPKRKDLLAIAAEEG